MKCLRRLRSKWLVWRGKAVDIWSKSPYPANVLSNLHGNAFMFDGIECGSMEGFLQSLKYQDMDEQRRICAMSGKEAKHMTRSDWQETQTLFPFVYPCCDCDTLYYIMYRRMRNSPNDKHMLKTGWVGDFSVEIFGASQ